MEGFTITSVGSEATPAAITKAVKPIPPGAKPGGDKTEKLDNAGNLHGDKGRFQHRGKPKEEAEPEPEKAAEAEEDSAKAKQAKGETEKVPRGTKTDEPPEKEPVKAKEETEPEAEDIRDPNIKRRIERLARERKALEAHVKELEGRELQRLREREKELSAKEKPEPKQAKPADGRPREEDYETYDAYLDARDAYNRKQWDAESGKKQQSEAYASSVAEHSVKAKAAVEKAGGQKFLDGLADHVSELRPTWSLEASEPIGPLNVLMDQIIFFGDRAPEVMSLLSKDEDLFRRFESARTPYEFERVFGKLEARLEGATVGKPPEAETPFEPAAKPVRQPTGGPVTAGEKEYRPGMSFDDYAPIWKAQQKARQQR